MPVRSATSPAAHPTRARVRSYRGFFSFLPFLSSFPFFTLRADGDCCGFDGVVLRSGLPFAGVVSPFTSATVRRPVLPPRFLGDDPAAAVGLAKRVAAAERAAGAGAGAGAGASGA